MRLLNLAGTSFQPGLHLAARQPIKDTLCGTKVLWKADYERIAANQQHRRLMLSAISDHSSAPSG